MEKPMMAIMPMHSRKWGKVTKVPSSDTTVDTMSCISLRVHRRGVRWKSLANLNIWSRRMRVLREWWSA